MNARPNQENKAATMKDVAQLAGVSQRTVSNVVSNYEHVSPAMRAKVEAAIQQLGFRRNEVARSLRQGRSNVIALVVPNLKWPYFSEIAHLVHQCARDRGYSVAVVETQGNRLGEKNVLMNFGTRMIDGMILSSIEMGAEELNALEVGVPVVLLGERIQNAGHPHFSINNVQAAREMAEHLLKQGARSFLVLGASDTVITHSAGALRMQGFLDVMNENSGLGVTWEVCPVSPWVEEGAYSALMDHPVLPASLPDAIFCMNDLLAFGAIRALANQGLKVPQDVLLSGWDDLAFSSYTVPALTTISPDKESIVTQAVQALDAKIRGVASGNEDVIVGHSLCIRESTRP